MQFRKFFAVLLTLTLLLGAFAPTTHAALAGTASEDGYIGWATVTASNALNLRTDASTNATVLVSMPRGAEVMVLAWSEPWAAVAYTQQVSANRMSVWVGCAMTTYLDFHQGSELPDDPGADDEVGWADIDGTATVTADSLLLRESNSSSANTVAKMYKGDTVTVVDHDDTWSLVIFLEQVNDYRMDVLIGFAMSQYLSTAGQEGTDEAPDEPGWDDSQQTATVIADSLWLRASPNSSADTRAKMFKGDTVIVLEKGEAWSYVQYGSLTGYSMNEFLQFNEEPVGPDDPSTDPDEPVWGGSTPKAVVTADSLWLRESPSSSAKTLAKMYKGETVTVLEKGNTWSRVQYGSLTGYSMNGFLQFVEEGGEAPEEPGWDDGGSDIPTKATATVIADSLWLRESPSSSAKTLAKMYKGETITVLEKGNTWSHVQYGSLTGYSMNEFLQFNDTPADPDEPDEPIWGGSTLKAVVTADSLWLRESPSSSAKTLAKMYKGETVTVLEKGDTWSHVQYGSLTGYSMNGFLQFVEEGGEAPEEPGWDDTEPDTPSTATATVIADSLWLRESPSSSAKTLAKMYKGETITVLERGSTWCRVQYGKLTGYSMTEFLQFAGESGGSDEPDWDDIQGTATVVSEGLLNLRASASPSATVIAEMPRGVVVTVLERGASWSKVSYNGMIGYAMNEFLQFN